MPRSQTEKKNDASTPPQPGNVTFKLATDPDMTGKQTTTWAKHSFLTGIKLRRLLGRELTAFGSSSRSMKIGTFVIQEKREYITLI